MFTYEIKVNEKNRGWTTLGNCVRPFTYGTTLDDTLDSGKINVKSATYGKVIKPFTLLSIAIYEDNVLQDTVYCLVANAEREMVRRDGTPLYNHNIEVVELSKLLERDVCDTMTVTNYLGHNYTQGGSIAQPAFTGNSLLLKNLYTKPLYYYTPQEQNAAFVINNFANMIGYNDGTEFAPDPSDGNVVVTAPDGSTVYNAVPPANQGATITLTQEGTYKIVSQYRFYVIVQGQTVDVEGTATWEIAAVQNLPAADDWTITEVTQRLLSAGVTRRVNAAGAVDGTSNDAQKYVFDSGQATQFANTVSPEFFFTRGTLWEALATVGGYIHGIPRLVYDDGVLTVKFDLLGGDEQYTGNLPAAVYDYKQILGDEYCGAVDSTVENLLNTTNTTQGTVVEPSATTFRAVNAPAGSFRIAPDAEPVILTDQPIYKVTKLEFWYSVGSTQRAVDLTPYVFENAEYQTLSSFGGAFPYSKSYALVYTQGQKNISGLVFTAQTSSLNQLKQNYAIVNILQAVTGDTASFNTSNGSNIPTYQFRVTYIPYVTTRITQRKPFLDYPTDNTLLYNQGGNSVENEYYGERLRGTIMRIGNVSWVRTFIFAHYADIPKCGQKIGNYYVARVDCEYERMYIKATVTAVENFNKLAEFIGINSNYRLYDVSEKQSVDRYVNYGESCVVSHTLFYNEERTATITADGIGAIRAELSDYDGTYKKITAFTMGAQGGRTSAGGDTLSPSLGMSAGSFASGNSIVMYATMMDNYGAGYQSVATDGTATRGQRLLPYGDTFGNISYADVAFGNGLLPKPNAPTPDNAFSYPAGGTLEHAYFSTAAINEGESGAPLLVCKDSREALSIILQQHFQSDNFNIIIGSGLTKYCPIVTTQQAADRPQLYFLNYQLNAINRTVSLQGITASAGSVTTNSNNMSVARGFQLVLPANDSNATAYAWVLANPTTGEIYIAENYPDGLAPGATPEPIYFNFLDNSQLKTVYEEYGMTN